MTTFSETNVIEDLMGQGEPPRRTGQPFADERFLEILKEPYTEPPRPPRYRGFLEGTRGAERVAAPSSAEQRAYSQQLGLEYTEWSKYTLGQLPERPDVPLWDESVRDLIRSQGARWQEILTEAGSPDSETAEWQEAARGFIGELGLSPEAVMWTQRGPRIYEFLAANFDKFRQGVGKAVPEGEWPSELKTLDEMLGFAETEPAAFMAGIVSLGHTPETDALLKQLGLSDKEVRQAFGERVEWQVPHFMRWTSLDKWPGWAQTIAGGETGQGGLLGALDWSYSRFALPWQTLVSTAVADIRRSDADKRFLETVRMTEKLHESGVFLDPRTAISASLPGMGVHVYTEEYLKAYEEWEQSIPGFAAVLVELSNPLWWGIPTAIGLRAGPLATTAARGGRVGGVAQATRVGIAPIAGMERIIGGALKYGVIKPFQLAARRTFGAAFTRSLLRVPPRAGLATTSAKGHRAILQVLKEQKDIIVAKAQRNLLRREKGVTPKQSPVDAARLAAEDTAEELVANVQAVINSTKRPPVAAASEVELRTLAADHGFRIARLPATSNLAKEGFVYRITGPRVVKEYARNLQEATNVVLTGSRTGLHATERPDRLVELSMKPNPSPAEMEEVALLSREVAPWQFDEALWAAEARGNVPLGTVRHPSLIDSPGEAHAELIREGYTAIRGSTLDEPSTALNRGMFVDKVGVDASMERYLAVRRQMGTTVADDFTRHPELIQEAEEVARGALGIPASWQTPTELTQVMGLGQHENPISRFIMWPVRRADMASRNFLNAVQFDNYQAALRYKMAIGPKTGEMRTATGHICEYINTKETGAKVATLLKKPEVQKWVGTFSPEVQRNIVGYAQELRLVYDKWLVWENAIRATRGQNLIPYRQDYIQSIRDRTIWGRTAYRKKTAEQVLEQIPDFHPTKAFNARALAREGQIPGYERQWDALTLTDDYAHSMMREVFYTDILQSTRMYTNALRKMGFPGNAEYIDAWVARSYAGTRAPMTIGAKQVVPGALIKYALGIRMMLNRAVFGVNPQWNMFIQTSSIGPTVVRSGLRNTLGGLNWFTDAGIRHEIHSTTYASVIKMRRAGKIAYQDIAPVMERSLARQRTPLQTLDHYNFYITSSVEDGITGVSCLAARLRGEQLGYRGRALLEYTSDGGALSQSMYNAVDLPPVLSPIVGAAVPFQTFALQMFNTVRAFNLPIVRWVVGKAGAYETVGATTAAGRALTTQRAKMLLEFLAAILVINKTVDYTTGRKPWMASSFAPFYNVLTGGLNVSNPWGHPLPTKYAADWKRGIEDILRYDNWDKMRKWFVGYHTHGGSQINRMVDALIAASRAGVVETAPGKTMFTIDPDDWKEWVRAMYLGPHRTKAGREYWDEQSKKHEGWLYEYFNLKFPQRVDVSKRLINIEGNLGTRDDKANYVTLGTFRSAVSGLEQSVGERRVRKGATPLAELFLDARIMWKSFYDLIPSDQRIEYREENPLLDASLYFWGEIATLRSDAARQIVQGWLTMYDIPEEALANPSGYERELKRTLPTASETRLITEYNKLPEEEKMKWRCNNHEGDAALVRILGERRVYGTRACEGVGPRKTYTPLK